MSNLIADIQSELALLGVIIERGLPAYQEAAESVSEADFCDIRAQVVWATFATLENEGSQISYESVFRQLRKSGREKEIGNVAQFLTVECNQGFSVDLHAGDILRCSKLRRIAASGSYMQAKASSRNADPDEILAQSEAMLMGEQMTALQWVEPKAAVGMLTDDLQKRFERQGKIQGVPTGLWEFDQKTDGLQYGEQTLIAARPSMGKTALGLNIAENAVLQFGIPTLFVSLEMSVPALMRRLLSSVSKVTMGEIRGGKFTPDDFKSFTLFNAKMSRQPLYFIPCLNGVDSKRLCGVIRRKVKQHGIKLVVIDYLQKIRGAAKSEKKTYELAEVSGDLVNCAKQTGAAFLTLAQLGRGNEKEGDRMPKLTDIADCGQIERDADTVALLHRSRSDESVPPVLIIAKQRDGDCGIVKLSFDGKFCKFGNPV